MLGRKLALKRDAPGPAPDGRSGREVPLFPQKLREIRWLRSSRNLEGIAGLERPVEQEAVAAAQGLDGSLIISRNRVQGLARLDVVDDRTRAGRMNAGPRRYRVLLLPRFDLFGGPSRAGSRGACRAARCQLRCRCGAPEPVARTCRMLGGFGQRRSFADGRRRTCGAGSCRPDIAISFGG